MVDDTPAKLRAQPYSLIAAPTFDYPLAPSVPAVRAKLDAFLLALVGVLFQLETESNLANCIKSHNWNRVMNDAALADWRIRGIHLLDQDGILVAAEGRGLLPGVRPSVNEPGYRTAKPVPAVAQALHVGVTSDTDRSDTTASSTNGDTDDTEEEEANRHATHWGGTPVSLVRAQAWRDPLGPSA